MSAVSSCLVEVWAQPPGVDFCYYDNLVPSGVLLGFQAA